LSTQTTETAELDRIGRALLDVESPGQAAEVFRQVLGTSSTDAAAFDGLGRAEMALQDYGAARAAFEQATRLEPANESARAQLALCTRVLALDPRQKGLSALERYERSRQLLKSVLSSLDGCATDDSHDQDPMVGRARQALASRRPVSLGEAADDNIRLVVNLWNTRPPACARVNVEPAVPRVLERLQR
jgi:tetratricopeptide (TPR) repeat protein